MFHTRVCDLLGIKYPIIQSPMNYPVTPALIAGVSNAGGLGICSNNMQVDIPSDDPQVMAEQVRFQIRETRKLTDKPIGVNLFAFADTSSWEPRMQVVIEEGIPIVYASEGSPNVLTKKLKDAGSKVMHIGTSVRHAQKAEDAGVDAFVCSGFEAGGHSPGYGETTLFTNLPQVVDAVKIPVLAGCGVGDARSFVAALALGAEGVTMATRFLATHESRWHPRTKQALIEAGDNATVAWGKTILKGALARSLKNRFTEKYLEMEKNGAPAEELQAMIENYRDPASRGLDRKAGAYFEADMEWGEVVMGAVSGLIKEIKSASDVVTDMVAEADRVLARLNANPLPARL